MIEVVIATLIVALIGAAVFVGFGAVAHVAGGQRHEVQANTLAQQDEERLRGLSAIELSASSPSAGCPTTVGLYGNECYTENIDGEPYTITSTSKFVSASSGNVSCALSGSGTADYIETASTVRWGANNDGRPPVVVHSLVSPPAGGGVITSAENAAGAGLAGVTITVQGPGTSTATQTLVTDSTGCAVFAGLVGGTYTVTASDNGYVNNVGATNPTQSVTVVPGIATPPLSPFQLDKAAVQATFVTSIDDGPLTPVNWDTFTVSNSNETQTFGTVGTYSSTLSSGALYPASYSAYAGNCTTDDPGGSTGTTGLTGATYTDPTVTPASGTTGSVQLIVPTMLLQPTLSYAGTTTTYNDHTGSSSSATSYTSGSTTITYSSGWTYSGANYTSGSSAGTGSGAGDYSRDETWSNTTGNTVTVTFTGTGITLISPQASNHGYAKVTLTSSPAGSYTASNSGQLWNDYASTENYQDALYTSPTLPYGTYVLTVTVNGTNSESPSNSGDNYVSIDGFIISSGSSTAVTSWPSSWSIYTYDSCATPVYRQASAPAATTVGSATVFPVQAPFGNSVQVCVTNTATGTYTGYLPSSTGQIANTNLNGTTITPLTLTTTSGATGASAVFTSGACPT
jgi:hypothetical protein